MSQEPTAKELVEAAAQVIFDKALNLINIDSHSWSTRPCSTCQVISGLWGKPFGCYWYAEQRKKGHP